MQQQIMTNEVISILKKDTNKNADVLKLHSITTEHIEYIDDLKNTLIEYTGGWDINGKYYDPDATEMVQYVFFEMNNVQKLRRKLENYSELLKSYGLEENTIVIVPTQYPLLKNDPSYKDLSFAELHFRDANLHEAISAIEMYKSIVLFKEALTINILLARR